MAPSGAPPRRSAQRARAWPARTEARHRRRLAAALAALLVAAVAATGASDQCRHGSPCFFAALRRTLAPSGPPSGPPDSGLPSSTPGDLVAQLKTGTPVVVDITAKWCGPCKVMEKTMVSLSNKYAGKVSVLKIDLDSSLDFAKKMNVRVLPTVLFFNGSPTEPVHVFKGVVQPGVLSDAIEEKLLTPQQVN
mmetsp:Transcript_45007/g.125451  ORF Transcript_45007/g.125451 Transcript_45007/m.125451 type:complete len:192 (+) Transcript_45007:2-577(+)